MSIVIVGIFPDRAVVAVDTHCPTIQGAVMKAWGYSTDGL
jgi:hypothetical protein